MPVEAVREWLEEAAFHALLGLEVVEIAADRIRLRLPFRARLTNNGRVLHGGIAAALAGVTSRALWLGAGGTGSAHLASLHVSYLAAGAEDLCIDAFLVRAGRTVCFTRTELSCASGKRIADALATLRLRGERGPAERRLVAARDVDHEPAPPAREIRAPFFSLMGLEVRGMAEGQSRIVLPWRPEIADGAGLHDCALLALLDAAGAMSSHAAHGAPAARNATIALQAQVFSPELPAADLLALGRCSLRDGDLFWNEIQIARHSTRELLAQGSVVYHIV